MPQYFVHRYDVVRIKVAVEADDTKQAMEKTDEFLAVNHPITNRYMISDEQAFEGRTPAALHYEEPGQEVTGYLVDLVVNGEVQYDESKSFEADQSPSK